MKTRVRWARWKTALKRRRNIDALVMLALIVKGIRTASHSFEGEL